MANTPTEAIAKAKSISRGYIGLCLMFVRICFGIDAKYPSAADAWANAKYKHRTTNIGGIPTGAPVFFSIPGNKYGHVAVYLGGGKFRTNYSARGTVVTASLSDNVFNTMKMLGWTEDINGVKIPGLTSTGDKGLKPGDSGARVLKLQQEMNKAFPSYSKFDGDGKYGPYTVSVVTEFQHRTGLHEDGIAGPKTIAELAKHGVNI